MSNGRAVVSCLAIMVLKVGCWSISYCEYDADNCQNWRCNILYNTCDTDFENLALLGEKLFELTGEGG